MLSVNLGLHFPGIGSLPFLKLHPQIARKMLLEAHRWACKQALEDGIADAVAEPGEMLDKALEMARGLKGRSKMGLFSLLRNEMYGEATEKFKSISHVHDWVVSAPAKAKI